MKKILFSLIVFGCAAVIGVPSVMAGEFTSCGPGYILVEHKDIDGIAAAECQKLWCRDLETGKTMGSGNRANTGYVSTSYPMELCDADGNCVECFGDRKWCSGQPTGYWNPEYGAYTYGGDDNATYRSYQRGSCFSWNIDKPECPDGQTATSAGSRESSIRRTSGSLRRAIR